MEESLTQGDAPQTAPVTGSTVDASTEPKADGNQETISTEQSQEAVSTATANTETDGSQDDGLAKFAKGQGIDSLDGMSERELKLLKIARDNQTAYRKTNDKKITEQVTATVDIPVAGESENASVVREIRAFKYEKQVDSFWADDKRDRNLEPVMANILKDKQAELAPQIGEDEARKYAYNLSRDLDTLYAQALIKSGTYNPEALQQEARQEERDSIKRKLSAAPNGAHAAQNTTATQPKVTLDWVRTEYNSKNPEHVKMVNDFFGKK